jgi:L-seryl-tRNA(Ser) seleniumtransferase
MFGRRTLFGAVASLPILGGAKPSYKGTDYFKELGVRPFINAAGTYTALTASLATSFALHIALE